MKLQDIPVREEQSLYEVRQKLYPRAVYGWFAGWRWSLVWATQIVFYGGCWLTWNGRQALLFDIAHRKFYLLGLVFWPQDVVYLAVLLIVSALSLFLFTALAGRLWCGYACPQTVYTEIFLWIERVVEGDRNARMRLDTAKNTWRKTSLKATKHFLWIAVALWTGMTFVGYFTPVRELLSSAPGPWEIFWVGFYGFATYGNAGWMREQVCKYMCPYARFQSAMFDKDTLIITYDQKRGEPRGKRAGQGDCVDCGICVQVCPTGIDIRDGLQYECIGCAACIDGCDQVMAKIGRPKRLIGYSHGRVLRPRVFVYALILLAIVAAAATSLWLRVPLKVDVIRDRAAIAREVGEEVENVYRLQIMNTTEQPRTYEIYVEGLKDIHVVGAGLVSLEGATTRMVPVKVRIGVGEAARGTHPISFVVTAPESPRETVREKSVFIVR
jgi:cytochrome c oxidase accessory protein FixG